MPLMQNRKRRSAAAEESTEPSPEPATQRRRTVNEDGDDAYGNDTGGSNESHDQMVKRLIRLALSNEYRRGPIRRAEISEKVLGQIGSRQFKTVFAEAQLQLRHIFGMEMVELPARERVTVAQKRAAKSQSQGANKTTASWVLVSILPTEFQDPDIIPPPAAPTEVEESKYITLYTILISLILLSGGHLSHAKLERYLRRMQVEDNTPLLAYPKTELLLKRMEKEGYILKIRESAGAGGEEDVYWIVGPRGKVEVGDAGTKGLVRNVYGDLEGDDGADLERRVARSLGLGEQPLPRKETQASTQPKKRGPQKKTRDENDDEQDDDEEGSDDDD